MVSRRFQVESTWNHLWSEVVSDAFGGFFFFSKRFNTKKMTQIGPKFTICWVLRGNRPFFFSWRFQWNSDQKWRFHVFFRVITWNLWWFHWNRGFLVELEALHPAGPEGRSGGRSGGPRAQPGVRPPTPPKIPRFKWIPPQVSSYYSKKHVNTAIFGPSFTEYRQEKIKKYGRVSTETVI